jgi:hypothetical protein
MSEVQVLENTDKLVSVMSDLEHLSELPLEEVRKFLANVEDLMKNEIAADSSKNLEIEPKHHFSKGVYAREISIPKGSLIVGKIHKFENFNILSQGELSIISIDGCVRVKAPYTVVSSPGVKRLAFAHEDSVWTTVHGTEEKDVEKIEEIFIAKKYEDVPSENLLNSKEDLCLG